MSNLVFLLKSSFINNTGINSLSKGIGTSTQKRKLMFSTFMLMFIGILTVVMSTTYSVAMATVLEPMGYLDLILVIAILACTILNFFTTIYKAQGMLFNSKDYDLLMSLPIKNSTILASKIIILMSLNTVITTLILVPASIVYFIYNGTLTWVYFLILIISLVFVPMIPIIISSVIAIIITFISSRFKHKNIATVILGMVISLGIIMTCFSSQKYINEFIANSETISAGIYKIYPPALYLKEALINNDVINLFKFIIISIVPFIIFIGAFAKTFKVINGKMSETYRKANYKIGKLEQRSVLKAITIQELRRYLATPIYISNTAFSMVLLLVASVATLFLNPEQITEIVGYPELEKCIPMVALALLIFTIGLSCTTNSSISLEGNRLWIIKSLPIETKEIFKAKILMNLIVTVPATIVSNILLFIGLRYEFKYLIFNLLISLIFAVISAILGLIVNIYFPKLDWTNPTRVVKQSISVLITMIFTLGVVLLGVGLLGIGLAIWFKVSNFIMFLSIVTIILLVVLVVSWKVLITEGVSQFRKL